MKRKLFLILILCLIIVSCSSIDKALKTNPKPTPTSVDEAPIIGENNQGNEPSEYSIQNQLPNGANSLFQTVEKRYIAQTGTPLAMKNFVHPTLACNWMGVAGQVFDMEGKPQIGYVVQIGGTLAGKDILLLAITGGNTSVGVGGYEIKLADETIASNRTLWMEIYNLEGKSLSGKINFDTYDDCEKNLIIINLTEVYIAFLYNAFFPLMIK
ncbi:MAG: hypothetical protein ABFD51_03975 [Anaerolineaceae bacterium]